MSRESYYAHEEGRADRFLRLSLMLSLEMVERSVMSDTPTCFFLNPSFQSA